jgi:hypothetical protein
VDSAAFLDVDDDGDADLIGVIGMIGTESAVSTREPLWTRDDHGAFVAAGTPDPDGDTQFGAFAIRGGITAVDIDGDHQMEVLAPFLLSVSEPRLAWIVPPRDGPTRVTLDRFHRDPPTLGWSLSPLFADDRPWARVLITINGIASEFDVTWDLATGDDLGDAYFDARIDPATGAPTLAAFFSQPSCATRSPICLTPMGATSAILHTSDTAEPEALCTLISTGSRVQPVAVFCEEGPGGQLVDRGDLARSLGFPLAIPGALLSWQIDTGWDLDANGLLDVVVTTGQDATLPEAMPVVAWLQIPGCYAATCRRYDPRTVDDLGLGHRHGLQRFPVVRADGTEALLVVTSSSQEAGPGAAEAWTWQPPPERRWVALQLGARSDWTAFGARVEVRWDLGPSGPRTPAVPPVPDDRAAPPPHLHAVMSTWTHPGSNDPIVFGVPDEATGGSVTLTVPGCAAPWEVALDLAHAPQAIDVRGCGAP